ncbi:MAG: family 78 glycoside hydrolase catalytic domain, partial [Chthoniobacterales bacterium]
GEPFASRDCIAWRVNYKDASLKEADWSEWASFELGLLSAKDWTAKWIQPSQPSDPVKERVGLVQRNFSTKKNVKQARLYVTAKGLFDVELNGVRVGKDYFANGFTAYQKRIDTLTYDITDLLRQGENTLRAWLGTGWYGGRFPFDTKERGPYGKDYGLLAQIEITFEDGSKEIVATDEKWEGTFDGPILTSSIYDGEEYDARRQAGNWQAVSATALSACCQLGPKRFPPIRQIRELTAQRITEPYPEKWIFDLGENIVGWARIKIPVEKDKTITIRFAEMLKADGSLYTENYRTAKSTDTYTAAANGVIEWEPRFTFHGFRYVELSGLPGEAKPENDWVTGIVMHSDLPTIGFFTSSNVKLNQLQNNIVRGWRGNSLDIPTDCPQRDERLGWTGDAQVFGPTAMFNTDSYAFWKSWLRSMRDEQEADGAIPEVIPIAGVQFRNYGPGWMDAAVIIPWSLYVRTGDLSVLEENYTMMERLLVWYRSRAKDGVIHEMKKGFGDWLQPYAKSVAGDTSFHLLGSAYFAYGIRLLTMSAHALGKTAEAERYSAEADAIAGAFANYFFDADGKIRNAQETQTSYILPIAFGLLAAPLAAKCGERLEQLIRQADGHLRTGFLGTPLITQALDATGHGDLACELLFKESYPSWFYPINQGATTMWERWNSYSHKDGFGDVSMNSFNHYAYGAVGQWMYERVAGLAPDPAIPGYKHFFIRPLIAPQLDFARAVLETPYGRAVSAWSKKNEQVVMDITVPPNTTATIEFPDGQESRLVVSGTHQFLSALSFK